ncbi:hypothetical protein LEMLEM_LOCUS11907 [Lemmus lemmus]
MTKEMSSFGKCHSKTRMLCPCRGSKAYTFRSRPVANTATLPSTRENITGVLILRDETLWGLGRQAPTSCP